MGQNENVGKLLYLDPGLIDIDPSFNLRPPQTGTPEYDNLAESIRTYGVLESILVQPNPLQAGRYYLINGRQRHSIVTMLREKEPDNQKVKTIPALFIEKIPEQALFLQLTTNLTAIGTKPVQVANALKVLCSRPENIGLSQQEILAKSGLKMSFAQFKNYLGLNKLIESAKSAVEAGDVKFVSAIKLAELPPEEQIVYLDSAKVMPVQDFKVAVEDRKNQLKTARGEQVKTDDPFMGATQRTVTFVKEKISALRSGTDLVRANTLLEKIKEKDQEVLRDYYWQQALEWTLSLDPAARAEREATKKMSIEERKATIEARKKVSEQLRKITDPDKLAAVLAQMN